MLDGFSVEESEFLRWAMRATQDIIGEEMTWSQYLLVILVLNYCVESGLYRVIKNEEMLIDIRNIDREYRKRESCGFAVC